jgi:MerR family mercuric resistance operon transcriptional regulator
MIAGFARAAGVGVETVRYYQRRGLLETPAQAAGFTLEQIRELLALDAGRDRNRVRRLARERIAVLDEKIAELTQARAALGKLARAWRLRAMRGWSGPSKSCAPISSAA